MTFVLFWLGLTVLVGVLASSRGRNALGYMLLSLIISPLLAALLLLIIPNKVALARHAELVAAIRGEPAPPTRDDAIADMMGVTPSPSALGGSAITTR